MAAAAKESTLGRRLARVPKLTIFVVFFLIVSLQVIRAAVQQSATFDEPANLASGYVELTRGDHWLLPENLPAVKRLAALPLLFVDVRVPSAPGIGEDAWDFGEVFLYKSNDGDHLLLLGRLAVLPLSLLLGCMVFLWGQQLFGREAGLCALFLYSFEPNILAHSGLVTTDLGVACWMFGTVYGLYQITQKGVSLPGLFLPGAAMGLGLLTKHTLPTLALTLLLLVLAASFAPRRLDVRLPGIAPWQATGFGRKLTLLLLALFVWSLVAYGILWAAYGFHYESSSLLRVSPLKSWDVVQPHRAILRQSILWAREAKILPEPYLYGLSMQLKKSGLFEAFLLGKIRTGGWWYFFLVTFFLKTPIPLLLGVGLAVGVHARRWREAPLRTTFLALPVLVYFTVISASGWNIGHRHLLPIYPFLFIAVGGLWPWLTQQRRWLQGALAALALWYLAGSLWIAPHYLAYFNELIGGPDQGYKYLVDSNLDWGQDLKGLKRYMEAHGIERIWLSYFGSASPDYYGIRYNYLPSFFINTTSRDTIPTSFVAISATNLQGVNFQALGLDADLFKEFRARQPIAKIGYSIFLYHLS